MADAHVTYNAIERLKTECRRTETKVITLANHSREGKQRQSDHGEIHTSNESEQPRKFRKFSN